MRSSVFAAIVTVTCLGFGCDRSDTEAELRDQSAAEQTPVSDNDQGAGVTERGNSEERAAGWQSEDTAATDDNTRGEMAVPGMTNSDRASGSNTGSTGSATNKSQGNSGNSVSGAGEASGSASDKGRSSGANSGQSNQGANSDRNQDDTRLGADGDLGFTIDQGPVPHTSTQGGGSQAK